jgi:nucleotide-binding universal stress UspA family protein
MKKILIATDGSQSALEAVELGLDLATEHEAEVTFVHVAPMLDRTVAVSFGVPAVLPHHVSDFDRAPVLAAAELAAERDVPARCEVLLGNPVDEIVAYADTIDADLIVLGSRGRGAIASALLGSVSRGVLHEARRPVLVVRGVRESVHSLVLA